MTNPCMRKPRESRGTMMAHAITVIFFMTDFEKNIYTSNRIL
jgi:hypothetical protein